MGLSLMNLGKKVFDQVNPFDNGRTYQNSQGNGSKASLLQQATHNGLTNTVGSLAKPIGNTVSAVTIDPARELAAAMTGNHDALNAQQTRTGSDIVNSVPGFIANNVIRGSQAAYNLAGKAPLLDIMGNPQAANQARTAGIGEFNKTTVGQLTRPIQYGIANAGHATPQQQAAVGLDPNATGAQKYFADPVVGAVGTYGLLKGGEKTLNKVREKVTPTVRPTVTATPVEQIPNAPLNTIKPGEPTPVPQPAPKLQTAVTGVPAIDKAVGDLANHYNSTTTHTGTAEDVVNQANAARRAGSFLSNSLRKVLQKNLTKEERGAVSDALEGRANENLTPKAAKVAQALQPLHDKALDVRQAVDPNVHRVQDYLPRIPLNTVRAAAQTGGSILGKINNLADLGRLDSIFSKNRQIGKFVDGTGKALYGKPSDLGLVRHDDGTITDAKGIAYKQTKVDSRELEANTGNPLEHNIARISGIYHGDTTSLKARAEAIKSMTENPNQHGLYTKDQVDNGVAPEGVRPIEGVTGLKDAKGDPLFSSDKNAKALEKSPMFGRMDKASLPGKVYRSILNASTQFIVLNPFFHGMNQLYQAGIAAGNMPGIGNGWGKVANAVFHVSHDDILNFYKDGGHSPDYGSTMQNILSRATGGATKVNSKAMAAIELRIRVGLYKASIDSKMPPAEAIKNIDRFLGDEKSVNKIIGSFTIFAHYFKTMGGAVVHQVTHPIEQKGSIINTIELAALTAAVTHGYQQATGNPNAYARSPGELGLLKELGKVPGELKQGEIPTILTNRVHPVVKEILQQAFNKDYFTGKPVTDTGRLTHAFNATVAPSQTIGKVNSGKRSLAESAANQLGINLPHSGPIKDKTTGQIITPAGPAAPNMPFLNVKGAQPVKGNDPTGHQQQQEFFSTLKDAKRTLPGDRQPLFDQLTASTAKLNDKQIKEHYQGLAANPDVLAAIVKQKQDYAKKSGTPLDPLYSNNITPEQRAEYFHMQSLPYKGDDYIQQQGANGGGSKGTGWMKDLTDARSQYFTDNPFVSASKAERVQSPKFDSNTEADLATAAGLVGSEKAQFIADHPNVGDAYSTIAKYTNDKRVAGGDAPFKDYPKPDSTTQTILKDYNALPQHDGKKGGNASRAAWITAHPDAYKKIQDYYTSVSEYELANSAGADKFVGATPSQQELKAAYALGKYDIVKNRAGVYTIDPTAAYAANSSSSSGFGSYKSSPAYKDAKYLSNASKFRVGKVSGRVKRGNLKVSIKKASGQGKKLALKSPRVGVARKIALKPAKV